MRRGFICAGCWCLDRVKIIDTWPDEESLARISAIDRQGGGSAHNVGLGLKRLDPTLPVEAIGLLGNDADGDFLFERASEYGLDTCQLHRTDDDATAFTDVMTADTTSRRTFFHHTGSNDRLNPDHMRFEDSSARFLHLGLLGVQAMLDAPWQDFASGWVAVLVAAQAAGLETSIELVSIDAARNRKLALPCLPFVDRLIVNDQEIGALAGIDTLIEGKADPERCLAAARQVIELGAMDLVVAHFPAGAVAVTRDGATHSCPSLALAQNDIVGSVGAGDAFAAGLLLAVHEGVGIDEAMAIGHAAAASSLRSATSVESIDSWAECCSRAGLSA